MGDVMVVLKVLPEDSDVDMSDLENKIRTTLKEVCEVNSAEIQEVAFGLKAIRLQVIVPDEEGKIDLVESLISKIDKVGQVDTEEVTLV
jgi:elongation factor 1-beta